MLIFLGRCRKRTGHGWARLEEDSGISVENSTFWASNSMEVGTGKWDSSSIAGRPQECNCHLEADLREDVLPTQGGRKWIWKERDPKGTERLWCWSCKNPGTVIQATLGETGVSAEAGIGLEPGSRAFGRLRLGFISLQREGNGSGNSENAELT